MSNLFQYRVPVQETVGGKPAVDVGLGSSAPDNIKKRLELGMPGAPFGGLGFFTPDARRIKLDEFHKASIDWDDAMYLWVLQPICNSDGRVISAEILVRAKNGSDFAPYEDLQALMSEDESPEVKIIYRNWKLTEIVDWALHTLKTFPSLQNLHHVSANLRPRDLQFFGDMKMRMRALSADDQRLLLDKILIEITEDQDLIDLDALRDWKEFGFKFGYDDTMGDRALQMLNKKGVNFHTPGHLRPILSYFDLVKMDIEWAGFCIFLSHPSYNSRPAIKKEILNHAQEEDEVWVPVGTVVKKTEYKHSTLSAEFADWCIDMIANGKPICIELSVSGKDPNNLFAIERLKDLGLDIFGSHKANFTFQGGPTGAKAFEPAVLAAEL